MRRSLGFRFGFAVWGMGDGRNTTVVRRFSVTFISSGLWLGGGRGRLVIWKGT
jgi:hypothetical protein